MTGADQSQKSGTDPATEKSYSNGSTEATTTATADRFDGLAARVEESVSSIRVQHDFTVTPEQLGLLAEERTRTVLADLLWKGAEKKPFMNGHGSKSDVEAPVSVTAGMNGSSELMELADGLRQAGENPPPENTPEEEEADKLAEVGAFTLTSLLLHSSPERGISPSEVERRKEHFGSNAIADKKLRSFIGLCWDAVQDFVLIMLIVLGVLGISMETTIGLDDGESCGACWIEGAAILTSVCIVVLVTASIDYAKQFAFIRLTRSLNETNTKSVIRDGKQINVVDDDIVVGDILSVNSHSLASIPADCVLLGPASGLKMDESTLTGESKAISKKPGDVILSGTTASQGSGKMVVIAVGVYSVSGKIKARVYESEDHEDDELGDGDENTPLFVKLDKIAKQVGAVGITAALLAFVVSCIIGLGINDEDGQEVLEYLMLAITVLAVAVPEGLPLAVTLSLAFSSNKMMKEQNLVKHLDACETMGCATTICTDKTGTLTANKMTARALYSTKRDYLCTDPAVHLGDYVKTMDGGAGQEVVEILTKLISIDTMNETVLYLDDRNGIEGSSGNPTEVALLTLVHELGEDYAVIRNSTRGRSDQGELAGFLAEGKQIGFSSARKMMSWAVPLPEGGYRLYTKGASEVVMARCVQQLLNDGSVEDLKPESSQALFDATESYARRGMRTLALAYRDLPGGVDFEALSSTVKNSDGSAALMAETELVFVALVGIEDPIRKEVPNAIQKCYEAGIDVRLVTGDSPNTAVSIAYQAGILRDFHFKDHPEGESLELYADNLRENVLMEGKVFRSRVYRTDEEGNKEFDQLTFDKIWPHLRVLARSSPDDKLTLAHGLNQSALFADSDVCQKLLSEDNITIFPDRQVVAMTGDGTNDAPALKRADIGFAMGIAGTQIAKDAADIILLDDNFASIVTAAKWGRNVYASIQKFLQFQLTVNISAVITALVGAFAYQTSPLAAIQLLWVNLLMDSLASLALASEPPVDALLQKPPVNRTDHMITNRMWANMLGHASYQVTVVMMLLFRGYVWFDLEQGHLVEDDGDNSVHYTLIFNTFVWMQLFNEVNCRKLKGEFNVFSGIQNNPLFCIILVTTATLQVLIVEYGSVAFHVADGGLDPKFWGVSLAFGSGSLPVQQVINVLYRYNKKNKGWRIRKRLRKDGKLAKRTIDGNEHLHRD